MRGVIFNMEDPPAFVGRPMRSKLSLSQKTSENDI